MRILIKLFQLFIEYNKIRRHAARVTRCGKKPNIKTLITIENTVVRPRTRIQHRTQQL